MKLVVATRNAGKLREIASILAGLPVEIVALPPEVELPEEGDAFEPNAIAKAVAAAQATGCAALGDDSGLEVDALGGAPGVYSARWGGRDLDDAGRNARLLAALADVPDGERTARFVCHAALATPERVIATARGACEGAILRAPQGQGGFGYDPIFDAGACSMAELPPDQKDAISHRGRAFRALVPAIAALSSR